MLRQAVARHDNAEQGKPVFVSSTRQHSIASTATYPKSGVLGQSRSSGNAIKPVGMPQSVSRAVKRTSSGLSKVIRSNASGFDENTPSSTSFGEGEIFSEHDFDSDIEIDLGSKTHFSPRDGKKHKTNIGCDEVTEHDPTASTTRRTVRQSVGPRHHDVAHPSSDQAVPWSSSPPSHLGPHPARNLNASAYTDTVDGRGPTSTIEDHPMSMTPAAAPKRRTLPWQKPEVQSTHPDSTDIKCERAFRAPAVTTPIVSGTRKALPWEKTSSAIKEQQRDLREKSRIKVSKATSDATSQMFRKKDKSLASVFLSSEQQHVANLVTSRGQSVFFTGSAGTGKSVLLREIIKLLRSKHLKEPDRVAVTASTGLAACNIGGVTLHSFAGFGLGKEDVAECVKKIKRNGKAKQRWLRTKILIIDEVSMVDADLFDKLEAIARNIRRDGRPFGGIQLVITGDFFQLPPVPDKDRAARFAFDADSWKASIDHTIGLHHVFRQKDPVFAGMLNEMREGTLTPQSIKMFTSLSRPLESENDLMATELFPTRQEVERANSTRMAKLVGTSQTYDARDGGTVEAAQRERLLSNCMAPKTLHLKKGSQVMLIKNVDEGLVNGSVGKVIAFQTEAMFDRFEQANYGPEHTRDEHEEAKEEALGDGDGHVQRIKSAAAVRIQSNLMGSTSQLFPLVRFVTESGTTRDLLCQRETWKVELPNGEVQASRSQVPLILAWALSIHKAQGQTLERVKVDLGRVFEKGQAYVALSRATSMAGLQVLRFDPKKVMAHARVREFYAQLSRVEEVGVGDVKQEKKPAVMPGTARTVTTAAREARHVIKAES